MKVLVTGHDGYIGALTKPKLEAAGHDVVGLDSFYYEGSGLEQSRPRSIPRTDIRDLARIDLDGFDAVVHLAALSNDPIGELDPELTAEINFRAGIALAKAAREAGVTRFVFASSCSMYGTAETGVPVDETAPLAPLTAYAASKVQSEEGLRELVDENFAPVFMRNATAFGVSPRLRLDVVLNNLVAWALTTGRVRILSDGSPWRPIVHVDDIASATVAVLEAPQDLVRGEAFNIGADSENYQVRELAEIVRETVPGCEVEYAPGGEPDPRSYRVDFGKFARAFPEFRFRWDARTGAHELYEACASIRLTPEQFESDRFIRLRRLHSLIEAGQLDNDLRWRE